MLTVQSSRPSAHRTPRLVHRVRQTQFTWWQGPAAYGLLGLALAAGSLIVLPWFGIRSEAVPAQTAYAGTLRLAAFVGSLLSLLACFVAIGLAVTGQRVGMLWTARNAYSLSRLQMAMWTLLVLAALAAVVACRAFGLFVQPDSAGVLGAVNIVIPPELLAVMGISITSAVATPAILSVKASSSPDSPQQVEAATARTGALVHAVGRLAVRDPDCPPLVRDLFQGDEVAKAGLVDMGKVQQAVVTLILWTAYLAMLAQLFLSGDPHDKSTVGATTLPPLSETFVYLLGISHAGYLAFKATPAPGGTPTGNASASPAAAPSPRPLPPPINASAQ